MEPDERPLIILMADDDPDDVALVADALGECPFAVDFHSVSDGYELVQYLHRRDTYAESGRSPEPDLILLDLNMPKRNGTELLAELKTTRHLRDIPIVVLTTSDAERDQYRTNILGADGYLTKPSRYGALVEMMASLPSYLRCER